MASHYEVLGLTPAATPDQLRQAFREAAKRVHPDARPGPTDAMVAVNIAYETLKDPTRRAAYDRALARGEAISPVGPSQAPQALDPATYRARVFLPLDRSLATALATLDDAIEALADEPFDDGLVDGFDRAVLEAAEALDEAYRGLYARLWPAGLAPGLALYCRGVQQAESALEDYFRFAPHYDREVLLEGRAALGEAAGLLTRARSRLVATPPKL